MGQELSQVDFDPADFRCFQQRLDQCLETLGSLMCRPDFDQTPPSIGAELEMSLIRTDGSPACCNLKILDELNDKRFTAEIDRFNLEYNSTPLPFSGQPFSALGSQLLDAISLVHEAAQEHGAAPVLVGILPTLQKTDLGVAAMTPMKRYQVLSRILREHRGRPFRIRIDGEDPLHVQTECVTFEGANTSLQLHLKVAPKDFVAHYNAAQIATGLAVAICGNSPVFLQHRLWDETRIVVFKQAVDDRDKDAARHHLSARVGLGDGWWQGSAHQALTAHLQRHHILLPICSDEDQPAASLQNGTTPKLAEITTHGGTIWYWNRPVYDPAGGGHLRIEFRALPSGPTVADMMANAALLIGLTLALAKSGPDCQTFAFRHAEHNLYRAAQFGLDAQFDWPSESATSSVHNASVRNLLQTWLPRAKQALIEAGVAPQEAAQHLSIIEQRLQSGQTGAQWQRRFLQENEFHHSRKATLHAMVQRYAELSEHNLPVHEWPLK